MIRCVLLDLDGILINPWRLYVESFRRILKLSFHPTLTGSEVRSPQVSRTDMTGSQ
jgi:phosphoglycolate phosphatase-like HAD superfamily hydrolase